MASMGPKRERNARMIRLPVDLDAQLVKAADVAGLSVNQFVERAVRDSLAARSGNTRTVTGTAVKPLPADRRVRTARQVTPRFKGKT